MSDTLKKVLSTLFTADRRYTRRSGGRSKVKVFSDAVMALGALLVGAVESGLVTTEQLGRVSGYVILALGAATFVLRALGPVPGLDVDKGTESLGNIREAVEQALKEVEKP